MFLHSIEFNSYLHPISLDNFEIAKSIFNRFNQGIKQIESTNDKIIFTSKLVKITKPLEKIQIYKGIYIYIYYNKTK